MTSATLVLPTSDANAIPRALEILDRGGIVAFPTETVYGLAARIDSYDAIERLFEAKGRDSSKAIAVLLGAIDQLDRLTADPGHYARRLMQRFFPGPLTLVVPKRANLPANLSPYPTVGVRMPDHPAALALLRASGPLATTSANLSGGANPTRAQDVLDQLDGRLDLLLDGGATPGGVPSTVVDCTGAEPVVLRPGPISLEQVMAALGQERDS
jgi:L-threonylcarbamoyladenylate synthase